MDHAGQMVEGEDTARRSKSGVWHFSRILLCGVAMVGVLTLPELSAGAGDPAGGKRLDDAPRVPVAAGVAARPLAVHADGTFRPLPLRDLRYAPVLDLDLFPTLAGATVVPETAAALSAPAGLGGEQVVAAPSLPLAEPAPQIAPSPRPATMRQPVAMAAASEPALARAEVIAEPTAAPAAVGGAERGKMYALALKALAERAPSAVPEPPRGDLAVPLPAAPALPAGLGEAEAVTAAIATPAPNLAVSPAPVAVAAAAPLAQVSIPITPVAASAVAELTVPARAASTSAAVPAPLSAAARAADETARLALVTPAPATALTARSAPAVAVPQARVASAAAAPATSPPAQRVAVAAVAAATAPRPAAPVPPAPAAPPARPAAARPAAPAPATDAAAIAPAPRPARPQPGTASAIIAQIDSKAQLLTRVDGKTAGAVDFQQTATGLKVRLGSIVEVLADRYDPAQLARIRGSAAGQAWLSLAELKAQGIPISYDSVYDEFNIGLVDTRPKDARKVHMDQITAPERGIGSTGIAQVPR